MSDGLKTAGNSFKGYQMRWPDGRDVVLSMAGIDEHSSICLLPADVDSVMKGSRIIQHDIIKGTKEYCIEQGKKILGSKTLKSAIIVRGREIIEIFDLIQIFHDEYEYIISGYEQVDEWGEDYYEVDIMLPVKAVRSDVPVLLTQGYTLHSRKNDYFNLRFLDCGGTSICYRGETDEGDSVLIKEVYPMSISSWLSRDEKGRIVITGESDSSKMSAKYKLEEYVERGIAEKKLEGELVKKGFKFFEPNYDWFLANNTIYTVYRDYGEGTLAQLAGKVSAEYAVALTRRILEPLKELHKTGYLHLDISPENILLGPSADGIPTFKFIDLGSLTKKDEVADMTQFPCKDGFSPFELFSAVTSSEARNLISEATDTFSVGAVLYNLLTGDIVSWSVCRCGGNKIIDESSPAVKLSESLEITVEGADVIGDSVNTVSPRVLDALNAFLAVALRNNPHKRFPTAEKMDEMAKELHQYMTAGSCYFAKSYMSDDFMEDAIMFEDFKYRHLGARFQKLAEEKYTPLKIREKLMRGEDVIIDDLPAQQAKKVIEDYYLEYGGKYHEAVFSDEGEKECQLFSGGINGSHTTTNRIDYDDKTLIVRYCGKKRNADIRGGVVAMENMEGESTDSLSFVMRPDVRPHYICATAKKRSLAMLSVKLDSISTKILPLFPVSFIMIMIASIMRDFDLGRRMEQAYDYYTRGIFFEGGIGRILHEIDMCHENARFIGAAAEKNTYVFSEYLPEQFLPLWLSERFGWYAGLLYIITVVTAVFILGMIARKSTLSMAAFYIIAARYVLNLAPSFGLWLGTPPRIFTSPTMYICLTIILAGITIADIGEINKKFRSRRYGGMEFLRVVLGIIIYILLWYVPYFKYWYGIKYLVFSMFVMILFDLSESILLDKLEYRKWKDAEQKLREEKFDMMMYDDEDPDDL